MSEKKPFDNVVEVLRHSAFSITDAEAEAAIRILEDWPKWKPLIEAAGRVDGKQLCEYQRGIVNMLNTTRVSAGGIPLGENSADMQILALLESLPEKEEK